MTFAIFAFNVSEIKLAHIALNYQSSIQYSKHHLMKLTSSYYCQISIKLAYLLGMLFTIELVYNASIQAIVRTDNIPNNGTVRLLVHWDI